MTSFEPEKTVIIFDLNGVVLRLSLRGVMRALWHCPHKRFLVYLTFNLRFIRDLVRGVYRKRVLEELIKELAGTHRYFAAIQDTAMYMISAQNPRTEMVQILEQLRQKKYQCAVLTNIGAGSLALIKARHPELFDYFTYVVCPTAQMNYRAKPALAVFVDFKRQLGTGIKHYIFIDDTRKNIEQASCVGMIALSFKDAQSLTDQLKKLSIL